MVKIVIGGQIDKAKIEEQIKKHITVEHVIETKSDLDAAMAMQSGEFEYYFGACNTGGGGAIAMALALCGKENCVTVSMPGNIMSDEEIIKNFNEGKKIFGFTAQHIETVVPIIVEQINNK